MSNAVNKIYIWGLALYRRPDTLKAYQDRSRHFLSRLLASHPDFGPLLAVGSNCTRAVPLNRVSMEDDIAAVVYDEAHLSDYLHLTPSGHLHADSLSRIGFSITYGSLDAHGQSMLSMEDGGMRLRLQGVSAGVESETSACLELIEPTLDGGPALARDLRQLLHLVLANWQCTFGGVALTRYQAAIKPKNQASYAGQWLYYLPFPNLASCLPPDIRHEPFANGILIETTPHLPDANNPADIAAGNRVRDVLDEFGLINDATYAIEGWPPDQEESLYEQFISGAPADRKYAVHCINFDGYDPDRKVLLYAKLFRRLKRHPKEWGLRGWDGPVLNEAKRQVRAAAKAGGVPIEWHIGLEEPAHQVRQLLADYTNITETQLRVIYTPLEDALAKPPS